MNEITKISKKSPLVQMAETYNVEPDKLFETLKQTCFKGASNEEMLALVIVANSYNLNPMLKHLFAFPGKGGIIPVVSVDGWNCLMNRQTNYDGIEFAYEMDENDKPLSCTATIFLKDRSHPVKITEFYDECFRNTDPWKTMPRRMLRHKALIQASRVAFGFSGIYDEDEAGDIVRDEKLHDALPSNCERVSDRRSEKATPVEVLPAPAPAPAQPVEVLPPEKKAEEPPMKNAAHYAAAVSFMEYTGVTEPFIIECFRMSKFTEAKTLAECPAGLLEQLAGKEMQTRILKRFNQVEKKKAGAK